MQFNWFSLIVIILQILVVAYFVWLAIVLNQVRVNNTTTVPTGTINTLYVLSIIFAVLAGIQVLIAILSFFFPKRFGFASKEVVETKNVSPCAAAAAKQVNNDPNASMNCPMMYNSYPNSPVNAAMMQPVARQTNVYQT